ncbi:hypothetical protein NW766_006494 [Fusarium irregulare]|uniref:Uncharacterized protein n=1 Tax=Fusarium irregulare TaxID=2494466 RepID=A0A9W8PQ05_9HYPO|nr:hypothetical protein NW766_006494 [Fusarium irregulare]
MPPQRVGGFVYFAVPVEQLAAHLPTNSQFNSYPAPPFRAAFPNYSARRRSFTEIRHPTRRGSHPLWPLAVFLGNLTWPGDSESISTLESHDLMDVAQTKRFYFKSPIEPPYKNKFWEVGERVKHLGYWLGEVLSSPTSTLPRQPAANSDRSSKYLSRHNIALHTTTLFRDTRHP